MNKSIILSIKPFYVHKILKGEKKYEFRKRLCKEEIEYIYIYSTYPEKIVVGYVSVLEKIKMPKKDLWNRTSQFSGIKKADYDRYFLHQENACAYQLGEVVKYEKPLTLDYFGVAVAPQSFVYYSEEI